MKLVSNKVSGVHIKNLPCHLRPYLSPSILSVEDCDDLVLGPRCKVMRYWVMRSDKTSSTIQPLRMPWFLADDSTISISNPLIGIRWSPEPNCFFLADREYRKSLPSASTTRPELLESCYDAAEGDDVEDLEEEGGLGYPPRVSFVVPHTGGKNVICKIC